MLRVIAREQGSHGICVHSTFGTLRSALYVRTEVAGLENRRDGSSSDMPPCRGGMGRGNSGVGVGCVRESSRDEPA